MVRPESTRPLAFLCHSSGDKERVRQLYWRLKQDGYACWFDEEDLIPGQNWEHEINRALRRCDYVVVCLSQSSVSKRGFLQKELRTALDLADELPEGEIFLVPVRLEPCDPPDRLRPLHWVDLFTDTGYRQLTRALQPRGTSDATVPASSWDRIVPPQLERQQPVPWEKYSATATSIFISYRRFDTPHLAGRLYDTLAVNFGQPNVFMDVDSIELGIDFTDSIGRAVAQCQTMIVLIGSEWLSARSLTGRRIDDPDDFIRLEIQVALQEGKRIIPVLVDGAQMPHQRDLPPSLQPLARRMAVRLEHATFSEDVAVLMSAIKRLTPR